MSHGYTAVYIGAAVIPMAEDTTPEMNLADSEHIECPYKAYASLHEAGGVGRDPNIGTIVAGV